VVGQDGVQLERQADAARAASTAWLWPTITAPAPLS
jgi:hypothetical protein